jgi:hypothetical protein
MKRLSVAAAIAVALFANAHADNRFLPVLHRTPPPPSGGTLSPSGVGLVAGGIFAVQAVPAPKASPWSASFAWDLRVNKPLALVVNSPKSYAFSPYFSASWDLFAGSEIVTSGTGSGPATGGMGIGLRFVVRGGPTFVLGGGEAVFAGGSVHPLVFGGVSLSF